MYLSGFVLPLFVDAPINSDNATLHIVFQIPTYFIVEISIACLIPILK